MTDETTTDGCIDCETDECTLNSAKLGEYRRTLLALHDQLDEIKATARTINGDLENLSGSLDDDGRCDCREAIQMSVLLYERVDRGDYQLLRGL